MTNEIVRHPFGNVDEIVEIQERIQSTYKSLFPNAAALTNDEAFALAQVGHMQGLDVFNKEIYYLKKYDGTSIGVMPGIRGLRKHAHRQIRFEGGRSANFWIEFERITMDEEKLSVGAAKTDIVTRGVLRDNVTMGNYLNMRSRIFGTDRSWSDLLKLAREDGDAQKVVQRAIEDTANEILGRPPIFVGYGIVKNMELKSEGNKLVSPLTMKNGQNPFYMAEIRAERRALYKRFDLEKEFGAIISDAETEAEYLDAQIETEEDEAPETSKSTPRTEAENVKQLGFE